MANTDPRLTPERMAEIAEALARQPAVTRIVAFFEADTVAGFVLQNVVAAWLVRRFPDALTFAAFRDAPPERAVVVDCNPAIAGALAADADAPAVLPVDWFDVGRGAPVTCPDPRWHERNLSAPDLVLLPGQLSGDAGRLAGLAERPPALRLSGARRSAAVDALSAAGLRGDAWFAAVDSGLDEIHGGRIGRHVAEVLGGGVCRLTAGEPFEATVGAVAHARFVIAGDPLALTLASAFRTPCAAVGLADFGRHVWNAGDVVLAPGPGPGPDAAAVMRAVDAVFAASAACTAWRAPMPDRPAEGDDEPAEIAFPLPLRDAPLVTVWS